MAYPDVPIWLELARLGRDFSWSGVKAVLPNKDLSDIERFCLFIGAPRTGHSLIGSLLDAHPEMVIAHELGAPKYKAAHFSRRQVALLLLSNSRQHAAKGRQHIHYSHAVKDQWQGRYRKLRVLGDKHGEGFLLSIRARPWLYEAVTKSLNPHCFIHVIRNPYDAIASVFGSEIRGHSLESAIAYFGGLYETLAGIRDKQEQDQLHEIYFEDFLARPAVELEKTCNFLGLEATPEYLESCVSIVLEEPDDHRGSVQWDRASRHMVEALIHKHSFLSRYISEQVDNDE